MFPVLVLFLLRLSCGAGGKHCNNYVFFFFFSLGELRKTGLSSAEVHGWKKSPCFRTPTPEDFINAVR